MLKNYKIKFFALVFYGISVKAFGQYNLNTNSYVSANDLVISKPAKQSNTPDFSLTGGFPCIANTFYATSSAVDQYMLTGNTATFVSMMCPAYLYSLAYCNNLNGGAFSPTFYDCIDSTAVYYDGSGWTQIPLMGPGRIFNCGGNGNFLYYAVAPVIGHVNAIARYDGVSFTTVYTLADTNRFVSVADLNVDDAGNVWFFTGPIASFSTDTLNVISPIGQVLKQFPFSFNSNNAYGSFMLNGIIYLGLGSANPVYPNTLLPVIIGFNSVSMGTPIPMPPTINYGDLASCNAGSPLAVQEYMQQGDFNVFPNPVNDVLTIMSNGQVENEFKIVDLKGSIVQTFPTIGETVKADVHLLDAGIYSIESYSSKGIWRRKFVKL